MGVQKIWLKNNDLQFCDSTKKDCIDNIAFLGVEVKSLRRENYKKREVVTKLKRVKNCPPPPKKGSILKEKEDILSSIGGQK